MNAVIESGGKQYNVSVGDIIYVEKLNVSDGDGFNFDKVLMVNGEKGLVVGNPYVKQASVSAVTLKNGKFKKIRVLKYKPKKNYMRTQGHRQPYTKLKIESIIYN